MHNAQFYTVEVCDSEAFFICHNHLVKICANLGLFHFLWREIRIWLILHGVREIFKCNDLSKKYHVWCWLRDINWVSTLILTFFIFQLKIISTYFNHKWAFYNEKKKSVWTGNVVGKKPGVFGMKWTYQALFTILWITQERITGLQLVLDNVLDSGVIQNRYRHGPQWAYYLMYQWEKIITISKI